VALTTPRNAFRIFADVLMQCSFVMPTPPGSRLISSICAQLLMAFCAHPLRELPGFCGYAGMTVVLHSYM
jgi:hypothetical protein